MTTINIKGWKRELQHVKIADHTHYTLKNGKRIPTARNMERQIIKGKI